MNTEEELKIIEYTIQFENLVQETTDKLLDITMKSMQKMTEIHDHYCGKRNKEARDACREETIKNFRDTIKAELITRLLQVIEESG